MLRARKRITKKELKHDAMLETIYKVEKYVRSNSKLIMYGGSALLVVIVISVVLSTIFGGQFLTYYLSEMLPSFDWQLFDWLGRVLVAWPGPFEVFFGNWNLIDV